MNIVVTISTKHSKPSKSVASGYVALLNAILRIAKVVDGVRRSLSLELHAAHGPEGASYMWELLPTLGEVQSVKFVSATEAAAAGEGKLLANTYRELHGNELARAQWDIEESLPKSVRFGTIEVVGASICRAKETLLALVIFSDGTRGIATIPLTPENIAGILG